MGARKGSAVVELAADLGKGVAHTPPNPGETAPGDLFADLDEALGDLAGHAIAPPAKRGPGRPAGSVNRTTKQLQGWLMARGYRDPAEFLASIMSADTIALARKLGIEDKAEVLKVQVKAAGELLPYFHQQMPKQVELQGERPRALIVINEAGGGIRAPNSRGGLSIHDLEPIQQVSAKPAEPSHGSASHETGQSIDDEAQSTGEADD